MTILSAALGCGGVPVDVIAATLGRGSVEPEDRHRVGGDRHDLVLAELKRFTGVPDEGRDVGAEVVGSRPEADHQGAVAPGTHHDPGLVGVDRQQGEGAVQAGDRLEHGGREVVRAVVGRRHQMGSNLSVGLGGERNALLEQLGLERVEVLDDPVVDERQPAVGPAEVGVGVVVGGSTVSGPTGMADGRRRLRQRLGGDGVLKVDELPRTLAEGDVVSVDDGHPGGVVAPVLQPGQPLHDDVQGRPVRRLTNVTHDSTHGHQRSCPHLRPCPARHTQECGA